MLTWKTEYWAAANELSISRLLEAPRTARQRPVSRLTHCLRLKEQKRLAMITSSAR